MRSSGLLSVAVDSNWLKDSTGNDHLRLIAFSLTVAQVWLDKTLEKWLPKWLR